MIATPTATGCFPLYERVSDEYNLKLCISDARMFLRGAKRAKTWSTKLNQISQMVDALEDADFLLLHMEDEDG